ncbi:MAG: glycosyl hydrolase-related protein [Trueperaceae bacterium]
MSRHNVTVVPHTHWDREWYQPFSVFQARLIETVDQVLDLLDDDPSFTHFMLDGQAVVLDDYLAIRPEAEERIRAFVANGRLAIGPWYTLADEFLASPEALVRNLQMGVSVCRRFGEPMPVVYTPDSFGHISQLPLLAHGFGFDSLVFERGVGDEGEEIGGEFRWRTADGKSSVLAVHLLTTYSSGAGIGYRDWSSYEGFDADRASAHADKALYGSTEQIGMEAWLDESLDRIPGGSSAYASGSNLLLLNGSDHLPPQTDLPMVIDLLNERIEGAHFRLGRLREFIDGVLAEDGDLREHRGEFRGSRYHHVLSGVFSARLYLKQANHAAQQSLERYAEPLSVLAYRAGAPYPDAVLANAWRDLLLNHCHDSICGCSIDAVHDEMMPRFAGTLASTRYLGRKALAHLSGGRWSVAPDPLIEGRLSPPRVHGKIADRPGNLTVFNPQPRRWRGVLEALLPVPEGFHPVALSDSAGNVVSAEVERLEADVPGDVRYRETQARVRWLAELEPLSVTSFRLAETSAAQISRTATPAAAGAAGSAASDSTDGTAEGAASPGQRPVLASTDRGHSLENEHLLLETTETGLLLSHKRSGRRVRARLSLVDAGDAGDEYDFSPVNGEQPPTLAFDLGTAATTGRGSNLEAGLRLSGEMPVPARLSDDRQRREGEVRMPFELTVRLAAGDPFVRLDLRLENRARDHRLRLRVDSDVASETVAVEGHFDVLERPVSLPATNGWFQKPSGGNHQRRFLAASDGVRGLAVFNAGLPEYAVEPTNEGVGLAVTLLRSVGWLSRSDLASRPQGAGPALPTPGAQCLGEHRFELALMPFAGEWDAAGVPAAADRFTTPPMFDATSGTGNGAGLLELPEGLLLSALKKAAEGNELILRFWNPGRRAVAGSLRLKRQPETVRLVDLSESPQRELTPQAEVPLSVDPKEVVSMAIRFGGEAMG